MTQLTITFGLHLDGQRATCPDNRLGEIVVGPLGFLNILETHLGLLADYPSNAERIVHYRDCLKKADTPDRFYHNSFAADALGTAATLLDWRDTWYLHGWNGGMAEGNGKRLSDMADVERHASGAVSASIGERLEQVLFCMGQRRAPIHEVRLCDPMASFSMRWQEVLRRLPVRPIGLDAAGKGFLGALQQKLLAAAKGKATGKLDWHDDGTVRVVRGETCTLAASWLATQIDEATPAIFVSGAEGTRLDAQLVTAGHPRQGLRDVSAFRPALQVLPLALELLWQPLNFYGLVQFLTHSVCPVPGYARWKLAAKVADAPGIGGAKWEKVLKGIEQHYGINAPEVREKIRLWIEHPRFSQNEGAPVEAVLERVRLLAGYFRARLNDADVAKRISFSAAHSQCSACAASLEALRGQGMTVIRPRQLQKLVAQATAHGADNPLLVAEVGARLAVTHPGSVVEPVDHVIWWQPVMPLLPGGYPWSAAEIGALANAGVQLPACEANLDLAADEWLRPILAAREHLTIVLPPPGVEVHPIWQMIAAVVERPEIQELELLLSKPSPATGEQACIPLPKPKRWWKLPDEVKAPLRKQESYSSLELLIFNPYHWLLRYPAALRPSGIVALNSDFRMLGNLAHALVERYYTLPDALAMTEQHFKTWFASEFDRLVSEEGALLQMSGKGASRENFRYRLMQAMLSLRQQFSRSAITHVKPELEVKGQFAGGELAGFADLAIQTEKNGRAIIDMKWSGIKKFPQKLKENSHLQLAIYAELTRQMTGEWPCVAYYILDRARLIAPDDRVFAGAEIVPSKSGENTAQLWLRFIESWKWRTAQFEQGLFEVALKGIEETDGSIPPENALAAELLNESYNDYRALAGWEQQ